MMDILNAISSVGFPIAACLALGLYVKTTQEQARQDKKESDAAYKELLDKAVEAIKNNTIALIRLVDKLGGDSDDIK